MQMPSPQLTLKVIDTTGARKKTAKMIAEAMPSLAVLFMAGRL